MKKLIFIAILLLSTILSFSQDVNSTVEPNYPIYQYDSAHNKIAVIISLKQARMMDNDYDILELLNKAKLGCDSLSTSYQIVIRNLDKTIATQDIKIGELEKLNAKNNDIIKNLNEQIKKYIEDAILCNDKITNKDKEIKDLNKEITKLKVQKIAGFTTVGVVGGGFVAILVTSFVKGWITVK